MHPEDRVLVALLNDPKDLERLRDQGWYRIPYETAPPGWHAEYLGFYFGRKFGEKKHAIHLFARQRGHELVRRRDLIPDQPNHPRADDWYFKIQLGSLQQLEQPILSLRWRRVTFFLTTGDRFQHATEIGDLLLKGQPYVTRQRKTLREVVGRNVYQTVRMAPPSTINVSPVI